MPDWSISLLIVFVLLILAILIFFLLKVFLPNLKATKERARKIDPSVKTMADANYVLSKELAKMWATTMKLLIANIVVKKLIAILNFVNTAVKTNKLYSQFKIKKTDQ